MNDLRQKIIQKQKLKKINEEITELINSVLANSVDGGGIELDSHDFTPFGDEYEIGFDLTVFIEWRELNKLVDELKPDSVYINRSGASILFIYKIGDI